jgi:hypothetical protein
VVDPALYAAAQSSAATYGVPSSLFTSIIAGESNWNPNAYNPASGASGLGQVLASTARAPGYGVQPLSNAFDPQANLNFSAAYLAALYQKTGSWYGAVMSYSGTPVGGTPYRGNSQQSNILSAAQSADSGNVMNTSQSTGATTYGFDPTTGAYTIPTPAGTAGSQANATPSTPGWIDQAWSKLSDFAPRGVLFVLAIILILGALMIFARNTRP